MDKKYTVTAIVPAYNEKPRIANVLRLLTKCKEISEIICVDDGSTDGTGQVVIDNFPSDVVHLVKLPVNKGKGNAMAEGILATTSDIAFFVDADLEGLKQPNISSLLEPILTGHADVVISVRDFWFESVFFRALSGERAYFRKDLLPIVEDLRPLKYKVEIFLNYSFHEKEICIVHLQGLYNPLRIEKTTVPLAIESYLGATRDAMQFILKQKSPVGYFYKAFVKNFYSQQFSPHKKSSLENVETVKIDQKLKVSVVIPAHNEEKYIEAAIRSVQNQSIKPDEIIVVDNSCTDKTASIAEALGCRVIRETQKGITHARNAGFDAARYDIIARIDADSTAGPDWIRNIIKHVSQGAQALTGPVYMDFPMYGTKKYLRNRLINDAIRMTLQRALGHPVWVGANMILTKGLWLKAKKFANEESKWYQEDFDLAVAVDRFASIKFAEDVIVNTSTRKFFSSNQYYLEYPIKTTRQVIKYYIEKENIAIMGKFGANIIPHTKRTVNNIKLLQSKTEEAIKKFLTLFDSE